MCRKDIREQVAASSLTCYDPLNPIGVGDKSLDIVSAYKALRIASQILGNQLDFILK